MEAYEFLVPGSPVSVHERDRKVYRAFKDRVFAEAVRVWPGYLPFIDSYAKLTIVFMCAEHAQPDVDNVIKPIMDALEILYYADDQMVSDVDAHRRVLGKLDPALLPHLMQRSAREGRECVYVRIQSALSTEILS
ncbi:MAG TPA: RusA family crossover junction endodeoxyribonuclease [Longimicrobium sp.]|nr:RusA family crossover junction endodeoxyribonuclease [Longimicrobium sp.]